MVEMIPSQCDIQNELMPYHGGLVKTQEHWEKTPGETGEVPHGSALGGAGKAREYLDVPSWVSQQSTCTALSAAGLQRPGEAVAGRPHLAGPQGPCACHPPP